MLSCHFLATGGVLFLFFLFPGGSASTGATNRGREISIQFIIPFYLTICPIRSSRTDPCSQVPQQVKPAHPADGEVWEMERQQARFGVWPCEVYFHTANCVKQLLSQTDPHNHNQNSHLQGMEKTPFFFFDITAATNPAVTSA